VGAVIVVLPAVGSRRRRRVGIAAYEIVGQQQRRISIPKRFTVPMREVLALQPRFASMKGRRAMNLLDHRRFRAAYDFMVLQAEVGLGDAAIAKFWTDVQTQTADERAQSFQMQSEPGKKRRPRRRRRKKSESST
jgi:poly(A) polymerase